MIYTGQCAELCGRNHANMVAQRDRRALADYQQWYAARRSEIKAAQIAGGQGSASAREQQDDRRTPDQRHPWRPRSTRHADTHCARPRPQIIAHGVDRPSTRGWTSWLTTTDHKRIGIMYLLHGRSSSSCWAASRRC